MICWMSCWMSGRSGRRLPQMHADKISITDHSIISTLSQVESYEFEYSATNLRQMKLVINALLAVKLCSMQILKLRGT